MERTDAVDRRRRQVVVAPTDELDPRGGVPIDRVSANRVAVTGGTSLSTVTPLWPLNAIVLPAPGTESRR